jgi:hypothetical protein
MLRLNAATFESDPASLTSRLLQKLLSKDLEWVCLAPTIGGPSRLYFQASGVTNPKYRFLARTESNC